MIFSSSGRIESPSQWITPKPVPLGAAVRSPAPPGGGSHQCGEMGRSRRMDLAVESFPQHDVNGKSSMAGYSAPPPPDGSQTVYLVHKKYIPPWRLLFKNGHHLPWAFQWPGRQ